VSPAASPPTKPWSDGGISPNTIRTHVRGVLEKTGCNRQVDIVALLTAISPARLTNPV
jgi:hypothetical protein